MNQPEAAGSSPSAGKSLGQAIREQRLRLGSSQEALAEAIGVSAKSISRWERDQAIPQEIARNRLCDVFGVDTQSLFGVWSMQEASAAPPPLWHVSLPRNPFFTGREELLHTLHERLKSELRLALSQSWAISGLGGIGKTQIALEYAYQHARDYAAVFWISAAAQETLQAGLVTVAECLQLPERDDHDQMRVIRAVKKWLASHQDWLLILDNADDVTLVQNVLPTERSGHLLLTTRAQALGPVAQGIEVETMGLAEGTLFLLRRAKRLSPSVFLDQARPDDLAAAEAIVIEMDFLPLALDQAGAYIDEVGCSLSSYLDLYRTHRAELLRRRGQMPGDYPASVATTWSLNFQQVEQANPAAAELLRLCTYLSPDAIPEELFSEGGAALGPALEQIATDAFALDGAMEELRKFSLVQRDPEARLLRLHRLVQAVLQDAMEQEERRQWAERAVRATSLAFPDSIELATLPRCRRFLPQAQMCSALIQDFTLVFEEAASLLFWTARYLSDVALDEQAGPLFQRVVQILEQVHGPEHPDIARSLYELADLTRAQGKYAQAEPLFQRVVQILEQVHGPEHLEVARALSGLATLYERQGKREQVKLLYQRALQILEQTLGPEHLDITTPLIGLAGLYSTQGEYEQAKPLFQRALHIRQQALGPDHPNVAFVLNNLAILYKQQEKYEQAESLYQRALQIWEKVLGSQHSNIAFPLYNLAGLYWQQRKDEQAESLYQRALQIWEKVGHPNIALALNGLANLSSKRGMDQQAESLYQRALSTLEQAWGEQHLDTAKVLYDFAVFREGQGKRQEAAALYQRACSVREQVLGAEHPTTLATRAKYLAILHAMGQEEKADSGDKVQWEEEPRAKQ